MATCNTTAPSYGPWRLIDRIGIQGSSAMFFQCFDGFRLTWLAFHLAGTCADQVQAPYYERNHDWCLLRQQSQTTHPSLQIALIADRDSALHHLA